jgi:hypothetical protein
LRSLHLKRGSPIRCKSENDGHGPKSRPFLSIGPKVAPIKKQVILKPIVPRITQKACNTAQGLGTSKESEETIGVKEPMVPTSPQLQSVLESRINARTGRRVRNLAVELRPERVVLHGLTATYYVKQLAQQEIRDVLPDARLENAIEVNR